MKRGECPRESGIGSSASMRGSCPSMNSPSCNKFKNATVVMAVHGYGKIRLVRSEAA
jgi:hypothetical protein